MAKIIIVAMLMLLPMLTIAQTENITTYANADVRGKQCSGGISFCPTAIITSSTEKTTASVEKTEKYKIQLSLYKIGFATKEWKELAVTKTFPVEESIKVDDELLRFLSIDIKFNTIKQGRYPVAVLEDKAIVVLELVERN